MKLFNIRILIYMGLLASFLWACEGNPINTGPGATGDIISVAINSKGSWQATPVAVDAKATEDQYDVILVTLSSAAGPAKEDIHVQMVPAPDSLPRYNSDTFDEHDSQTGEVTVPHPELYYVIPGGPGTPAFTLLDNGVVTIPKGSNFGYMKVKTTSLDYLGATSYAYVYRIASIQEPGYTISANNGYSITPFLAKNAWDGRYKVTGTMNDVVNSALTAATPFEADLITQNLTDDASYFHTSAFDDDRHPILSNGALSVYGAFSPVFTFDSNNNVVAVVNAYGQPASNGRSARLDPTGVNKYDPVTKVLKVKYIMVQGGSDRTTYDEVWTYSKSR